MRQIRLRYLVLLISIIMIIAGLASAWLIQNNFGTVITTELDLLTADNVVIHSTLQVPIAASSSNPMPGVVVIHGVIQSKEWLSMFGIELSRRGFIVLTIDARGHGNSGSGGSEDGDAGGIAALEYLDSQSYVSKIGLVGHSMGAGIARATIDHGSVTVDALVLVDGGTGSTWANSTYPNNLLVTLGQYSHSLSSHNLTALADTFGTSAPIEPGTTYGNFSDGTARKLVIGPTDHLFSTADLVIVSETVAWLKNSLKDSGSDPYWLPKENLIYPLSILGGLISCLGILLSIFPVLAIVIDFTPFDKLKLSPSSNYAASTRKYWVLGLLYGIIALITFLPALIIGPFIPFSPQWLSWSLALWLLGNGLIAAVVLFLFHRYLQSRGEKIDWSDWGIAIEDKTFLKSFGTSALLALVVIVWLYCWTLPVDWILALDFRAFFPLFNDLTIVRLLIVPIYLIFTIPFFVIEGMWLMGLLRSPTKETWIKTQLSWTMYAVFIKCLPYLFILCIQIVMSAIIGTAFIQGTIGFYLLFLWMFVIMYVVSTVIMAWSYRLTSRVYVGAVLNGLIFSWIMAAILPLAI
ncbi:MAG: dienelactone hydrolase family protein [Candidatus Hermodarchaeota archaeon]